ncbi:hypothetical protein CW304_12050 [Bacillus sp. UFRGS-B20]|nr:hypothetical protein CW304_12050 [Bacillus sp. UFRGS-B20]
MFDLYPLRRPNSSQVFATKSLFRLSYQQSLIVHKTLSLICRIFRPNYSYNKPIVFLIISLPPTNACPPL